MVFELHSFMVARVRVLYFSSGTVSVFSCDDAAVTYGVFVESRDVGKLSKTENTQIPNFIFSP